MGAPQGITSPKNTSWDGWYLQYDSITCLQYIRQYGIKNKKQKKNKTKQKQKSIVGRMGISILNISIKNIMRSQLSYKAFNSPISLMSIYVSTFLEKKNDHRGGFVGHFHFF